MFESINKLFCPDKTNYLRLIKAGALIVDVRSTGEFESGNIGGSINIPIDQLCGNLKRLKNKDSLIITCCASGMRSLTAMKFLISKGYNRVYNGGGWQNLIQQIKPKMKTHFYNVDISWNKDRKGTMCSPELQSEKNGCIEVATPSEFPKGIPNIWSPEHLFTAAVNSCLMTTFLAIAENSKLPFTHFRCKAKGKMEQIDGKFLMTEIILEPTVRIQDEKDRERAERVLQKSEAACLISNSIRSRITMNPHIEIG